VQSEVRNDEWILKASGAIRYVHRAINLKGDEFADKFPANSNS
jgi:hypothetical protein